MSKPTLTHKARKRFGQNFLIDQGIIQHIVRSIRPKETDNIIEIGPGKGAITSLLIDECPNLQVVELDRDLVPILLAQFANFPNFKIHQTDALKFDFGQLATEQPLRVVGNLPYNISTPLIFHLLSFQQQIRDMHFMLQKEVVDRLAASPGDKNYGRLSVMTQYYCQVEWLFDVPPESFRPMPKVNSAIVRLTPHQQLPYIADNIDHLKQLVTAAFSQRRKTLRNALKPLLENFDGDIPLDLSRRAESVSLEEYVHASNIITQQSTEL